MSNIPDTFDYQTIFQILAAFEGFSVWKVTRVFKTENDLYVLPETFDAKTFSESCEALKNADNKWRGIWHLIVMVARGAILSFWGKFRHGTRVWWWRLALYFYYLLALLLRTTPLVTIPLIALSYMFQIGCENDQFCWPNIVCYFIIIKTVCYGVCFILLKILLHHETVPPPASVDDNNILPP